MPAMITEFTEAAKEQLNQFFEGKFPELRSLFTHFISERVKATVGQEFEFELPLPSFSLKAVFVLKADHKALRVKGAVSEEFGVPVAQVTDIAPYLNGEKTIPAGVEQRRAVVG